MAVQSYNETSTFEIQEDDRPLLVGYADTIEECTALAANLLSQAINGETINRCWDCSSWAGRCNKGRINQIARSEACEQFSPKLLRR